MRQLAAVALLAAAALAGCTSAGPSTVPPAAVSPSSSGPAAPSSAAGPASPPLTAVHNPDQVTGTLRSQQPRSTSVVRQSFRSPAAAASLQVKLRSQPASPLTA